MLTAFLVNAVNLLVLYINLFTVSFKFISYSIIKIYINLFTVLQTAADKGLLWLSMIALYCRQFEYY